MKGGRTINKEKGVQMIADFLYSGKTRKEILQILQKNEGVGEATADRWIAAARGIVEARLKADEETRARVQAEQTEEIARRLGISREWLLTKFKRVADLDIRKIYNEDWTIKSLSEMDEETATAIASIEMLEVRTADGKLAMVRKIKGDPRTTAAVEIGKLMGWYPQTSVRAKIEDEDAKGNKKSYAITLNLG